jgi:hypothetical protein
MYKFILQYRIFSCTLWKFENSRDNDAQIIVNIFYTYG